MNTTVLGLDGLAARMGELVALGADGLSQDRATDVVADLTSQLDTLRSGLAEAEQLSQQIPGIPPA